MKSVFLILCCALAIGCADETLTDYVYCTGEGTSAWMYDSMGWDAWKDTDHPCCEDGPAGHMIKKDEITCLTVDLQWDTVLTLNDQPKPSKTFGIGLGSSWEFDKTDLYTFFFGTEGDWVLQDEEGRCYLKVQFGGKNYRAYLEPVE